MACNSYVCYLCLLQCPSNFKVLKRALSPFLTILSNCMNCLLSSMSLTTHPRNSHWDIFIRLQAPDAKHEEVTASTLRAQEVCKHCQQQVLHGLKQSPWQFKLICRSLNSCADELAQGWYCHRGTDLQQMSEVAGITTSQALSPAAALDCKEREPWCMGR